MSRSVRRQPLRSVGCKVVSGSAREKGAQGSRLADPAAGAAFGLLGLLAAQKP